MAGSNQLNLLKVYDNPAHFFRFNSGHAIRWTNTPTYTLIPAAPAAGTPQEYNSAKQEYLSRTGNGEIDMIVHARGRGPPGGESSNLTYSQT